MIAEFRSNAAGLIQDGTAAIYHPESVLCLAGFGVQIKKAVLESIILIHLMGKQHKARGVGLLSLMLLLLWLLLFWGARQPLTLSKAASGQT